jgi:hypothetical protein
VEKLLEVILSEYGAFVVFLLISHGALLKVIKTLWGQNVYLGNKMLETVENNTRVMTQLVSKLDKHDA